MTQPITRQREAVRLPYLQTAQAEFSLSQTQRRLAHRQRSEALRWEAEGNRANYLHCILEARRLWRDAKWHFQRAKINRNRSFQ
ncbi:hypothetical protein EN816_00630 [Mesorhizobium sp. M8A.F.Ca.ET.173.01.1.1]|nr:hypothetical protein EN816_00630 [Mesorhizobium sp. M8A.F.Ca.ET.173.01.1.1]